MFKGVDTSRPWPDTGMTSKKWEQIPPIPVYIRDLIFTQEGVYFAAVQKAAGAYRGEGGDIFPHVVVWLGKYYLEDGHSRAVRRMIDGSDTIMARVLTVIDHGEE